MAGSLSRNRAGLPDSRCLGDAIPASAMAIGRCRDKLDAGKEGPDGERGPEAKPASASRISLAIITDPGHANAFGTIHGGVLLRLADECGAVECAAARGQGADHDGRDRLDDVPRPGVRRRAGGDRRRGDLRRTARRSRPGSTSSPSRMTGPSGGTWRSAMLCTWRSTRTSGARGRSRRSWSRPRPTAFAWNRPAPARPSALARRAEARQQA